MIENMKLTDIEHHFINVNQLHRIHVIEAGNRQGPCVVFMHGGPGSGVNEKLINYLDCEHYHVLLIDQRGCGLSAPCGELSDNNLDALISDIEVVRQHFGIDRWSVTAGSWGSLLALCYAIEQPEKIDALVLRGCFLGRASEIEWLYTPDGASRYYPDIWEKFVEQCPANDVDGILTYYQTNLNNPNEKVRWEAACRWLAWASISMGDGSTLLSVVQQDREGLIAKAKIMCHFIINRCFLPSENYILTHLTSVQNIPMWIIHGREDVICLPLTAWQLCHEHGNANLTFLEKVGHSPVDVAMTDALRNCFEELKNLT